MATALRGIYDIVADPTGSQQDFSAHDAGVVAAPGGGGGAAGLDPAGRRGRGAQADGAAARPHGEPGGVGPLVGDYTTGSWGDECRDFYLSVRVPAGEVDDKMLAARVTLVVGGEPVGQGLVTAEWTDDVAKSTRMNKRVAEAIGEGDLADVIQEGVDAHHAGDIETATDRFGAGRAHGERVGQRGGASSGLSKLVEIDDPVTGRVRPKAKVEDVDVMTLETRSTRTSRTSRSRPARGEDVTEPVPERPCSETADYCSVCGAADGAARRRCRTEPAAEV